MKRRISTVLTIGLLVCSAIRAEPATPAAPPAPGLVPCHSRELPPSLVAREGVTVLAIAPRNHAPERPPEGWCGETAIQEAMLYHGAWVPQRLINAAGHPRHPDLYSNEVPVALRNLGMQVTVLRDGNRPLALDAFMKRLRQCVDAGVPVLCGVKINPTRHPQWGLDHFVLGVGHTPDSITFNTTWGRRETRTDKQLRSTTAKGFGFENRYRSYYGLAIPGPAGRTKDDVPVRLFVDKETKDRMTVIIKCEGLAPGREYALYRLSSHGEKNARPVHIFTATGTTAGFRDTIDKKTPAVYRCQATSRRDGNTPIKE